MTSVEPATHVPVPSAAALPGSGASPDSGLFFGDLLDIVNPLQHIPIVSTIYRAITGDQIKTFPKIAGDALFGGVVGFASSVADSIFEKITGKSVGDTVLAWVEKEFSIPPSAIALTAPAASAPRALIAPAMEPSAVSEAALDSIVIPGHGAMPMTPTRKGVDPELAVRAATAYRSTIDVARSTAGTALH